MTLEQFEIREVRESDIHYMWANMRASDRAEMSVSGLTPDNYLDRMSRTFQEVVLHEGVPMVLYGANPSVAALIFALIGTDQLDRFPKTFTRSSRSYVRNRLREHFPMTGLVFPDVENTKTIRWLDRIGFEQVRPVKAPNGAFMLMEYKGVRSDVF
ncbi:hypothetical protein V5T82_07280 [Magnetovibrio sp. PR-2]|uniref:hypothetical protein n=1 Tax=Magnetovibrio sp. PR-2 TaxID=3120356 RepID=UPI002FCE64FC